MNKQPEVKKRDNRYISEIEIKTGRMKEDIILFNHYVYYLENEDIQEPFSASPAEDS